MKKKIKKLIINNDCIDTTLELNRSYFFDDDNGKFFKRNKKTSKGYQTKNKRIEKRKHVYTNKKAGIISMEMFLKNYLGITGEALNQMKNISHDDLLKFNFEEVKRVPSDLVDGYGSQFFYVMDSSGVKLGYYNPLEQLKIRRNNISEDGEILDDYEDYINYINRNMKGTEKYYQAEYYDDDFIYDEDDIEEDFNKRHNKL